MYRRVLVYTVIAAVLIVLALILFPPWQTVISGNSYPPIGVHWIGTPPAPIGTFDYRIDVGRLLKRIGMVIFPLVIVAYGTIMMSHVRRGKETST
jgi:hypothetical protein